MKHFVIITLLLALSFDCMSQSWSALRDEFKALYARGEFTKAIPVAQKAVTAAKSEFGDRHYNYVNSLNNLAIVYTIMNRYTEAEPLFTEANRLWKIIPGDHLSDYATGLNNLAALYKNTARFKEAETLFSESLALHERISGKNSEAYANTLTNLGSVYNDLGWYARAESVDKEAIRLWKAIGGQQHQGYTVSLNNLANVYQKMGLYEWAEQQLLLSLSEMKKYLGENNPFYASSLNNLGNLYDEMGVYDKSEQFYLLSAELTKKQMGTQHADYANCLSNLSILYAHLGQYDKATKMCAEALLIREKVLGKLHPEYAVSLNLMGGLLSKAGQYANAEKLKLASLNIFKQVYGEGHPVYITGLSELASFYYDARKLDKAEPLYLKVKELRKKTLGDQHPQYAITLMDLAAVYFETGRYNESELLLKEAMAIHKKNFGEHHAAYTNALYNDALLSFVMNKKEQSVSRIMLNNRLVMENMILNSGFLSEKEKNNFLETNINRFDFSNSLLYRLPGGSKELAAHNFRQLLRLKSLVLSDSRNILQSLRNSKDSTTRKLFESWMMSKNILSRQYALPSAQRMPDIKKLEDQAEKLEKELNIRSSGFQQRSRLPDISLREMQQRLDDHEAAIEFVRFKVYRKGWTDSVMYAAYVFSKADTVPAFVPLFEERQLLSLLKHSGNTPTERAGAIYDEDLLQLDDSPATGDSLYKLIWQPLEPFLKDIKTISYSPAGQLYAIAFHALPSGGGGLLMDRYRFRQYTNTREIAGRNNKTNDKPVRSLAAFGHAQFTMDSTALVKNRKPSSYTSGVFSLSRGNSYAAWSELPATMDEVKEISELFTSKKKSTSIFLREKCSEENIKSFSGRSPDVLHIATHGFFLPQPDNKEEAQFNGRSSYALNKDPLIRNGLVFAGGNYAWTGNTQIKGVEDGICTAYEIAQLDLSNTQLVVLSACETALGDIGGSEGVFGLQRAFKMAGAGRLIVSLWQVPDRETAELMTTFYSVLLEGKSVSEAFAQAQSAMRKKYRPVSWAAFVLVE